MGRVGQTAGGSVCAMSCIGPVTQWQQLSRLKYAQTAKKF